jgi:predicted nucleotide-binding protein (sugar kinase/HSP70/actin superfamily)
MADSITEMREQEAKKTSLRKNYPNLVETSAKNAFTPFPFRQYHRINQNIFKKRQKLVIGMPRVLNMYLYAPFFSTFFRTLGVTNIIWSDYTSQTLWNEGNSWGAIDPCFPAKVAPAHIHNLLTKNKLTTLCFPCVTHLESIIDDTCGNNACPIQMGTPEVVHAAFTKYHDVFADYGVDYWKPLVNLERRNEAADMLYDYFKDKLELHRNENDFAVRQAYGAMDAYLSDLRRSGIEMLNWLVDNDRIGILAIGHPYHNDPGLNHGILEEFQMRGFPVLSSESLPIDNESLMELFGSSEKNINDVWKRNFNRNINMKIWAAKFASRHPNLAVVDFSSFKCGFDAPTYSYVDNILDASETPHFFFHDIDQNKPRATFAIRIQTIEYFLKLEQRKLTEMAL